MKMEWNPSRMKTRWFWYYVKLYGQVARKSSRPKSCCPKFIVMSPDILSHVARNFIMLKKILKLLVRVKCDLVTWVRCCKRTCNAQPIYSSSDYCQTVGGLVDTSSADTTLPKAAIVTLKGLLAWSNFISALDTGIKVHCIILLCTRNDLVFQLADYLGMRLLLLIYPLYTWLTGSKFTCDRLRKQGTTEQVAIIYAVSDPKGNDANTLCSRG